MYLKQANANSKHDYNQCLNDQLSLAFSLVQFCKLLNNLISAKIFSIKWFTYSNIGSTMNKIINLCNVCTTVEAKSWLYRLIHFMVGSLKTPANCTLKCSNINININYSSQKIMYKRKEKATYYRFLQSFKSWVFFKTIELQNLHWSIHQGENKYIILGGSFS